MDDADEVWHFFQQLGLSQDKVCHDLVKLSRRTVATHEFDLLKFCTDFPVLFNCLLANFGLMPISSRIAEQLRSRPQQTVLHDSSAIETIDAKHGYLANNEYHSREEWCQVVKDRLASIRERRNGIVKSGFECIKHDREKPKQMLGAQQLLDYIETYNKEHIWKLPESVLKEAQVRDIHKKGLSFKDKDHAEATQEAAERRAERKRSQASLLEEFEELAAEETVDNDALWMLPEGVKRLEDYKMLLSISHWNKVPAVRVAREVEARVQVLLE